jgi:hypothetical protein
MGPVIAERKLVCIEPSGSRIPFTVRLGTPYENPEGDWACPVSLEGLEPGLADIHGADSFQALMLARRLAFQLLMGRAKEGARFVDPEEDYDVELAGLFDGGL